MRNIQNSGYYLILTFVTVSMFCCHSFVCLYYVEPIFIYYFYLGVSSVYVKSRVGFVCLSVPLGLYPRIFSHPNVLPMLGACQSPPAPHPIIITHWMPYGSLYNVLHEGTSEYYYSCNEVCTCHHF